MVVFSAKRDSIRIKRFGKPTARAGPRGSEAVQVESWLLVKKDTQIFRIINSTNDALCWPSHAKRHQQGPRTPVVSRCYELGGVRRKVLEHLLDNLSKTLYLLLGIV